MSIKLAFALVLVFLLSSCVPSMSDYYFIEINQSDSLNVSTSGKHDVKGFINHESMPLTYELNREAYSLSLSIIENRLDIHMVLSVTGGGDSGLEVIPLNSNESCGAFRQQSGKDEVIFIWGIVTKNCVEIDYDVEREPDPALRFQVVDKDNGQVVGAEMLPYKIKKNGKYVRYDSL